MKNTCSDFFMFFPKKRKKNNLTIFFSFFKKIRRLEFVLLFLSDVALKKKKKLIADVTFFKSQIIFFNIIVMDTSTFTVPTVHSVCHVGYIC